ncbi:MAG TPA: VIT and VWA domain-containing protein, partial [Beijerinckiaceae bacterium]|nr:VIT and VWA domain-containing protein [Beijerinckiaceae bacterium]
MRRTLALLAMPLLLRGEAGVLATADRRPNEPETLAIAEMEVRIRIDNHHARVETKQIFRNAGGRVIEGVYTFALPARALVADFAVWDDVTRIPGVILERRRAEEIYEIARAQAIDPGLLQQGEHGADEARRSAVFTARIAPIPAYGTKRVELTYDERLPVEDAQIHFALPLRPDMYRAQTAGRLSVTLEITSTQAIRGFTPTAKTYPLRVEEQSAHRVRASFEARNVSLTEDLAVRYAIDSAAADQLSVTAHRATAAEPGFFEASALVGSSRTPAAASPPRTIIALLDTSLSMQWEKLERAFLALDRLLRGLRPADRFNVLLFNSDARPFTPAPGAATPEAVEKALEFVRGSALRGGTALQAALDLGLRQATGEEPYLVLITDGGATSGPQLRNASIARWYATRLRQSPRTRTFVFAVGDDANLPLLRLLTQGGGLLEWVRSTEPAEFKLNAFLSKIGQRPLEQTSLSTEPRANFDLVYPLEANPYPGSLTAWVGQYRKPGPAALTLRARRDGAPVEMKAQVTLPAQSLDHPHLPRTWAKARVDALLEKIEREGEDRASIDEIIRLARKYKFVTPYTSFLAAPRSLLRPRLIRPGDPVLRVRTDPSIASVVALFPFGLVKPLRYLAGEDIWQTRFLAPVDLADGTHRVRLILRDREGRVFRESKTFVIASRPPEVRVRLEKTRVRRGETVRLRVGASETSRTIMAR